jgi:hypothetical protein
MSTSETKNRRLQQAIQEIKQQMKDSLSLSDMKCFFSVYVRNLAHIRSKFLNNFESGLI